MDTVSIILLVLVFVIAVVGIGIVIAARRGGDSTDQPTTTQRNAAPRVSTNSVDGRVHKQPASPVRRQKRRARKRRG